MKIILDGGKSAKPSYYTKIPSTKSVLYYAMQYKPGISMGLIPSNTYYKVHNYYHIFSSFHISKTFVFVRCSHTKFTEIDV